MRVVTRLGGGCGALKRDGWCCVWWVMFGSGICEEAIELVVWMMEGCGWVWGCGGGGVAVL